MAELNSRIEQFKKMAQADPENELGHFSLGKTYLEAGEFEMASHSLARALDLNPNLSRAYELLATCYLKLDKKTEAIDQLQRGVNVAHSRGDVMPKNSMIKTLEGLGAPVPQTATGNEKKEVGEGEVQCGRCGRIGPRMSRQPFKNDLGAQIFSTICAPCWREWIGMGTKVINELRLPLNDPQAQKVYDTHMKEFLNLK